MVLVVFREGRGGVLNGEGGLEVLLWGGGEVLGGEEPSAGRLAGPVVHLGAPPSLHFFVFLFLSGGVNI